MSRFDVEEVLKQVEHLLAVTESLPAEAELAIDKLLNMVEALCSDRTELADEIGRLQKQLDKKKKTKTTGDSKQDNDPSSQNDSNHSSDKRRKQGDKKPRKQRDRRSFKDLTIHETIECPVDPATLPPDAVRVKDEEVIVQDIEIKPRNIRFQRSVYYSAGEKKHFRGPLPAGYDIGDFGANLRALILSLKYCGNPPLPLPSTPQPKLMRISLLAVEKIPKMTSFTFSLSLRTSEFSVVCPCVDLGVDCLLTRQLTPTLTSLLTLR